MNTVAARFPRFRARVRAEQLAGVLPLVTIYIWLCLLYGWEAWGNLTPWLFTDELEHTQFSRAIAETGRAARRGVEHSPDSLYAYVIAPAWWISDTSAAYGVAKAIGIAAMTAAIFPTYALARMLVPKTAALVTATLAVSIPAFAYSSLLLQEPLAYGWAALALWLTTRMLVTPTRAWIAGAVAVALLAPLVRSELVVVPAALVVGFALWWLTGPRGVAWRRGWSAWDWAGFLLLAAGVVILVNGFASSHSTEWLTATQHYKGRMVENGAWAIGAFVIGIGILPVAAAIAALAPGRWSQRPPVERALLCVALPTLLGYGWYTAVKASYISTVFSTLVEERNFIYAGPAIFVLAALFFDRQRTHVAAIATGAVLLAYLIVKTPYHMYEHFYADAPGLSILQSANRVLSLTPGEAQIALLVIAALCLILVAAAAFVPGRWLPRVVAGAALLVLAWNLTGQITGARSSHEFGDQLLANFPQPYDWVDRATHRKPAFFYGQRVNADPNGVWLLEFWNRSIQGLWTLDASGVGPGPTGTPDILNSNGEIRVLREYDYAITDQDVAVVGRVVATRPHFVGGRRAMWTVTKIERPVRLEHNVDGVYPDGWAGELSGYSHFSTYGNASGFLVVTVSREAGGKTVPARVRLRVGKLVLGRQKEAKMGEVLLLREASAPKNLYERFVVDAPPTPFRADVRVWPPFTPHDLDPASSDLRELGAQVSYEFVRRRPLSVPGRQPQVVGVYRDGWVGAEATYTIWSRAPVERQRVTLSLSRPAGPLPARARIRIAPLERRLVGESLPLQAGDAVADRTVSLTRRRQTLTFRAPSPPFRILVRVSPLFTPGGTDTRSLGARVSLATD